MAEELMLRVGDDPMRALVARPGGAGPYPGIVVCFHKDGLDGFTAWVVDELGREGFVAIAPDHFHVLPPGKGPEDRRDYLSDQGLALDLATARAWLELQDDVDPDALGILGHCMGGRTTILGAASDRRYKAACVWYGGSAFAPLNSPGPAPAERVHRIAAKVMGFFGNDDKNPSPADVDKLSGLMTGAKVWHEFHRYDGAGHGFMNPDGRGYAEAAAKDSWTRALAFLKKELA